MKRIRMKKLSLLLASLFILSATQVLSAPTIQALRTNVLDAMESLETAQVPKFYTEQIDELTAQVLRDSENVTSTRGEYFLAQTALNQSGDLAAQQKVREKLKALSDENAAILEAKKNAAAHGMNYKGMDYIISYYIKTPAFAAMVKNWGMSTDEYKNILNNGTTDDRRNLFTRVSNSIEARINTLTKNATPENLRFIEARENYNMAQDLVSFDGNRLNALKNKVKKLSLLKESALLLVTNAKKQLDAEIVAKNKSINEILRLKEAIHETGLAGKFLSYTNDLDRLHKQLLNEALPLVTEAEINAVTLTFQTRLLATPLKYPDSMDLTANNALKAELKAVQPLLPLNSPDLEQGYLNAIDAIQKLRSLPESVVGDNDNLKDAVNQYNAIKQDALTLNFTLNNMTALTDLFNNLQAAGTAIMAKPTKPNWIRILGKFFLSNAWAERNPTNEAIVTRINANIRALEGQHDAIITLSTHPALPQRLGSSPDRTDITVTSSTRGTVNLQTGPTHSPAVDSGIGDSGRINDPAYHVDNPELLPEDRS